MNDLERLVARDGPITVERFMALANEAYYAKGQAIGREGDFITAPEISQVFGEMIGAWCAGQWEALGSPDPVRLVELGPGRGTLMADLLRVAGLRPAFRKALDLHLVETSPALQERQRQALGEASVTWHDRVDHVPEGPFLLVANEFLDALPIRQFLRTAQGWRERMVAWEDGKLTFQTALEPADDSLLAPAHRQAPLGAIAEISPAALRAIENVAARIARCRGFALFIDYGPMESAAGDSLQAVRRHRPAAILDEPGGGDLTAHVDFHFLAEAARRAGVQAFGPVTQGDWLCALGIEIRTQMLAARAHPDRALALVQATRRLIAPREMGTLFKTMTLAPKGSAAPPGYEVP